MTIYRVTLIGALYGQLYNNVLAFDNPDGALSQSQVADEFDTNWVDKLKIKQMSSMVYSSIRVQSLEVTGGAAFTKPIAKTGSQGNTAQDHTFISVVFQIRTAFAGRHGYGRFFAGPPIGGEAANNFLTSGGLTSWNTNVRDPLFARFKSIGGSGPMILGIWDRVGHNFHAMQTLQVRTQLGVQRRRNIGVGA